MDKNVTTTLSGKTYTDRFHLRGVTSEKDLKKVDSILKKNGLKKEDYDYLPMNSVTGENDIYYVQFIANVMTKEKETAIKFDIEKTFMFGESNTSKLFDAIIKDNLFIQEAGAADNMKKEAYALAELLNKLDLKFQTTFTDAFEELNSQVQSFGGEAVSMDDNDRAALRDEFQDIDTYISKLSGSIQAFIAKLDMVKKDGDVSPIAADYRESKKG